MAEYMAQRIINGVYDYSFVVGKRADLKTGIDAYLTTQGRQDLMSQ